MSETPTQNPGKRAIFYLSQFEDHLNSSTADSIEVFHYRDGCFFQGGFESALKRIDNFRLELGQTADGGSARHRSDQPGSALYRAFPQKIALTTENDPEKFGA